MKLKTLLKNFLKNLIPKKTEPSQEINPTNHLILNVPKTTVTEIVVNSQITDAVTQTKQLSLENLDKQGLLKRAKELGIKANHRMRKNEIKALIEKAGK